MNHHPSPDAVAAGARARRARRIRFAAAIATFLATPLVAGTAYAFWTGAGVGAATGASGTLQDVTIGTLAIAQDLRPGTSSPATLHLDNPNAYAVQITSIQAGSVGSDHPGCGDSGNPSGVTLDLAQVSGTVPPGGADYPLQAAMSTTSPSACQGATFSASMTLVVRK